MNNCIDISLSQEVDCHLPPKIQDIFACYALSSKNIRNKTVFCISNIQSAYIFKDNQFILKDSLHTNEQDMINKANRIVHLLNQKNAEKYQLNCDKSKENKKSKEDKIKEIKQPKKLNVFGSVIDKKTFYQSVNKTFIETLIREQEESYTSKTSFACNEALREYGKGKKHEGNNSQLKPNPTNTVREGQRLYKINANKKSLLCHADLNGAMNIGRKVLSEFNIKTLLQAKPGVKPKELYQYRMVKLKNYGMSNTNLNLV